MLMLVGFINYLFSMQQKLQLPCPNFAGLHVYRAVAAATYRYLLCQCFRKVQTFVAQIDQSWLRISVREVTKAAVSATSKYIARPSHCLSFVL